MNLMVLFYGESKSNARISTITIPCIQYDDQYQSTRTITILRSF
jgi:hypothetical protein